MDPRPVVPMPGPSIAADPFAGMAEKLDTVGSLGLRDQVEVFTDVHAALNAALSATAAGGDDPRTSANHQARPAGQQFTPGRPGTPHPGAR